MIRISLSVLLLVAASTASAQSLTLVDDVNWPSFRTQCLDLLKGLDALKAPLPADTTKALHALLAQKTPANTNLAAHAVQKLLDQHCLIGVHINPESRVKAARGARRAELKREQTSYVLVKVHNEGGVTQALSVASEQAIPGKKDPDRWLEMAVINSKPFANKLSGQLLEYRVLRLTARQEGKREATLSFDVGQGTQDLGFRAEVPILFTVSKGTVRPPSPGRTP